MCATCKNVTDAATAKQFVLAGNATFTLASKKTGKRFTFKVQKSKDNGHTPVAWFVKTLYGSDNTSDYAYVGMIKNDKFGLTQKSKYTLESPQVLAFDFVWSNLVKGQINPNTEFWHEGHCGRCGRLLTVPHSIETGIGPECAKLMGL